MALSSINDKDNNDKSNNDSDNFECYICCELAQDPIVTQCGHLFCWPCLYKWLHVHSHSYKCPVCKALIEEEKVVPLYGRGRKCTDRRSKCFDGVNIPNRPSPIRPERVSHSHSVRNNNLSGHHQSSRFMGGFEGYVLGSNPAFGNLML